MLLYISGHADRFTTFVIVTHLEHTGTENCCKLNGIIVQLHQIELN